MENSGSDRFSMGNHGISLQSLIDCYIDKHQAAALREKSFFEGMPSIELAIHHAAFAIDDREPPRRYSHQRRIRLAPMRKAQWFLSKSQTKLRSMKSFDELHGFLHATFSGINGIGALYTYDTALRIGFYLRLEPSDVYLHAGTREGARALGIKGSSPISFDRLPKELCTLAPHEIENFLCIFKPGRRSNRGC